MVAFSEFLSGLGNLHDCTMEAVEWSLARKQIRFSFDDIAFNFEGPPGYGGPVPGQIVLHGVESVALDVKFPCEAARVLDFLLESSEQSKQVCLITFWPSGRMRVAFERAEFPELPDAAKVAE